MEMNIKSIICTPLKRIKVDGGDVLRILRSDDLSFNEFNEAYFSIIEPGKIKAWKRHLRMTMNLVVPYGMVEFVFFDNNNFLKREIIGEKRYSRLTVPPMIWFGFKCISKKESLILNISDTLHSPDEVERKELSCYDFETVK
tara:strand:- start:195 stop:620 length:426 start_codon:yes stop_codon:yes gene_type:complete